MVKTIGSCIGILVSSCLLADPVVTLSVTDLHKRPLKQAGKGIPFLVQVTVDNAPRTANVQLQTLAGCEQMAVSGQPYAYQWYTNGKSTFFKVHYKYQIRCDREGTFVVGPAHVRVDGNSIVSNSQEITVASTPQVLQESVGDGMHTHGWIRVNIDTEKPAVVGQQIPLVLTAYLDPSSEFVGFEPPVFEQFTVGSFQSPEQGVETVAGKQYRFVRIRTTLATGHPGTYVLSTVSAQINVEEKDDVPDFFGGFSRGIMFGHQLQRKRIISDAVSITVHPLPSDTPVTAVGSFESIAFSVDQTTANVGEGIVGTLRIRGAQADITALSAPPLQAVPGMKWYESKQSIDAAQREKIFEYIIQCSHEGQFRIPAQKFNFYDPYNQKYTTLMTDPIDVHVRALSSGAVQQEDAKAETSANTQSSGPEVHTQDPSNHRALELMHAPWYPVSVRMISWRSFGRLVLILILLILVRLGAGLIRLYSNKGIWRTKRKKAFITARRCIALYEQHQDTSALYQLFMSTLATRLNIDEGSMTQVTIEERLRTAGFDAEKIGQWNHFLNTMARVRFFSPQEVDDPLFSRARYWIIELEKRL